METFEACATVNDLLVAGREAEARDQLIRLLDQYDREDAPYGELVNHLIRQTGLYPYLQPATASWQERFVYEAFKVDIGGAAPATLHREQSALLRRLIDGEDLAISAPTSFGKSFVIDAYIAITNPTNVVIIVPTLALTDETRRRLHRKFAPTYKVITTAGVQLGPKNIFVFPQERAQAYLDELEDIDLLVVDEFYKASPTFDKDRSPALLRAILQLRSRAKQRYFLAPNISSLNDSPFTRGMTFERLDFNTVFLEQHHLYEQIGRDPIRKTEALLRILRQQTGKTLIYAGTYSNIDRVSSLISDNLPVADSDKLTAFAEWLGKNYDPNWNLTAVARRGAGIHNGQLHRSLSQIQVKLFEEDDGLATLISTSSIVEGVNTSAENVVLWSNKKGAPRLDDFTYKNIMGRGGRMFRHFIGKIYVLEAPPAPAQAQLDLAIPDQLLGGIDEEEMRDDLTPEQVARVVEYRNEMRELVGHEAARRLETSTQLQTSDWSLVRQIAQEISRAPEEWLGLRALNFGDPGYWDRSLYRLINLRRGGWDIEYNRFVAFIKILADNWTSTIPELLDRLEEYDIGVNMFFRLERNASFKLAALVNDVSLVAAELLDDGVDLSAFAGRLSSAFLPPLVYQLEEYGLPRMIARKIHSAGVMDLEASDVPLHEVMTTFSKVGHARLVRSVPGLDDFDAYILDYFLEGIATDATATAT